jgi:predicted PolB exonuclease-like 3'-5' exonuclease
MRSTVIVDLECVGIDTAGDYVEPVSAPANYKDPEKIAAYMDEARAAQIAKCALDPDLARIVALGVANENGIAVSVNRDEDEERAILGTFWAAHDGATYITFNGHGYDLPMLMRRSLYLGVGYPAINIDRYRSPHIDLMQRLTFNGVLKPHSLKFYCKRFGIPVDDAISGADIPALVKAGEWDKVRAHCESDVRLTYALAARLGYVERVEAA